MANDTGAKDGLGYYRSVLQYRARISQLYAEARGASGSEAARLEAFREGRDRLLAGHPHSPVPAADRETFAGTNYYPYDPRLRFSLAVRPDPRHTPVELEGLACERVGWVEFRVAGSRCRLALLWIHGYAGGLFLPFADATTGTETFGGGRHVWDSLKGADLGFDADGIVVDFNYALHPSSAYDPSLKRPAPPEENRLEVAIRAGERLPRRPRSGPRRGPGPTAGA